MANKKMPDKTVNTVKLDIGKSGNDKDIYICSKARYLNTLTIGSKGTGKSSFIMPTFIAQDLKNKNLGLTIITSRKDMSYYIQAMANDEKRKITLIKPTLNPNIENRLFDGLMEIKQIEESSGFSGGALYDLVNEDFINYKNAIKRKHIVVIDMENLQYGDQSVEAVLLFLKQLEIDIQETKVTNKTNHFVYIDDANYYLKGLTNLLEFGNEYNLGFNLFIRSRSQLVVNGVDYRSLIDDNIRTTILLNSLNQDDIDFYSKRFTNLNIDFYNRDANSVVYDSINSNFKRISGVSSLPISDENYINNLNLVSAKRKNKLIKKRDKDNENKKKELLRETAIDSDKNPTPISNEYLYSIFEETDEMKDAINSIKEDNCTQEDLSDNVFSEIKEDIRLDKDKDCSLDGSLDDVLENLSNKMFDDILEDNELKDDALEDFINSEVKITPAKDIFSDEGENMTSVNSIDDSFKDLFSGSEDKYLGDYLNTLEGDTKDDLDSLFKSTTILSSSSSICDDDKGILMNGLSPNEYSESEYQTYNSKNDAQKDFKTINDKLSDIPFVDQSKKKKNFLSNIKRNIEMRSDKNLFD